MPGLFDSFDNLDIIDVNNLAIYLKSPPSSDSLENYLANKILYPTTLPLTMLDMKVDLAILREALRIKKDSQFLNITSRKIIIPGKFLQYIPDLVSLTWAFVDGLLLNRSKKSWYEDQWTVMISGDIDEVAGTVLLPQFEGLSDLMSLTLMGREYKISAGSLTVVPCSKSRCQISYKFKKGKILDKNINEVEVYGGKLGLMIDGRAL